MTTVGVVTGSRADFGIYLPVLKAIEKTDDLAMRLYVCGAHLSEAFGYSINEIEAQGIGVYAKIDTFRGTDGPRQIGQSVAAGVEKFSSAFSNDAPDLLLVLGDRYEMFAAAVAATVHGLFLAHIHGGELSEGANDEAFRHSITKMSHLHFVSTNDHARRVIQLGEQPDRVYVSGAPGLDNVKQIDLPSAAELEGKLGIPIDPPPVLVTFHPVTLEPGAAVGQIQTLLQAINDVPHPIVFTYPNADAESAALIAEIEAFVEARDNAVAVPNLGLRNYFGLMARAVAMIGNSSSGIIEAASFELPVINIGDRQRGRARGPNVIDVPHRKEEIERAFLKATDPVFRASLKGMENPYGDGTAGMKIAQVLSATDFGAVSLKKQFNDIRQVPCNAAGNHQSGQIYG